MPKNVEARRGGDLARAPGCVCLAADNSENTRRTIEFQARWLARRLGLTIDRAKLLAGLAFATLEAGR